MGKKILRAWLLLIAAPLIPTPVLATAPQLMLLETYQRQNLQGWVMSEKLDGIRGYWDGTQLFSRQNQILTPPDYFIRDFPPFAIDGELFSQRNQFEQISSVVRSQKDNFTCLMYRMLMVIYLNVWQPWSNISLNIPLPIFRLFRKFLSKISSKSWII